MIETKLTFGSFLLLFLKEILLESNQDCNRMRKTLHSRNSGGIAHCD